MHRILKPIQYMDWLFFIAEFLKPKQRTSIEKLCQLFISKGKNCQAARQFDLTYTDVNAESLYCNYSSNNLKTINYDNYSNSIQRTDKI